MIGHDVGGALSAGAVYAFARPAGGWSGDLKQTARLIAGDGVTFDQLGSASGVDGAAVVGRDRPRRRPTKARCTCSRTTQRRARRAVAHARPTRLSGQREHRARARDGRSRRPPCASTAGTARAVRWPPVRRPTSPAPASPSRSRTTRSRRCARRRTDRAGNTSACSGALTYVEDSAPPGPPALAGTAPGSPGNATAVRVTGTAEPRLDRARLQRRACAGPAAAEGPAAEPGRRTRRRRRAERGDNAPGHGHRPGGQHVRLLGPAHVRRGLRGAGGPGDPRAAEARRGDTATYVATVSDTGGAGIDPAAVQWTPGRGWPRHGGPPPRSRSGRPAPTRSAPWRPTVRATPRRLGRCVYGCSACGSS